MTWQRIKGHDAQVRMFQRAAQRGRMAHAYLFVGLHGVGKYTFARELAHALLCEGRPAETLNACDRCAACVQVEAGSHPDLFTAARPPDMQELPIRTVRELCQSFALKSARGRGKVLLIDDADDLNEEATNAFLKTLEEPPPGSVLILIGTTPERQYSTIVSRCQVVRFAPLSPDLIEEVLRDAGVENADARAQLLRAAEGSPGRALELNNQTLWDFRRKFLNGLASPRPPTIQLGRDLMTFVEEAGKDNVSQRRRLRQVLRLLIDFLDDALSVSVGREPRRTPADERSLVEELAARTGDGIVGNLLERCLEADRQVERNVQTVLVVEALLDAMGQKLVG